MLRIKNTKSGMSLLEIIIVVGLVMILSLLVSDYLAKSIKAYRLSKQSVDLQEKAARVMREFEFSARAATEVVIASPSEFSFYRYYDLTSASPTLVRYFTEGSTFKVGKTEPVGTLPNISYPPESEVIDFLVENIDNPEITFSYFAGTGSELALPVDKKLIRMVRLAVSLDKNADNPPLPISESTVVSFRNMKDNL